MKTALKYLEQNYTQPCELKSFVLGDAVVFSSRSPLKDTVNEDAAAIFELEKDQGVLVVADGMGGLPQGEQASSITLNELQTALSQKTNMRDCILNGIEAANSKVVESKTGAGTTLALVEVRGRMIRPYHVGDSEILLVGQRGKLKLHTVSHSPTSYALHAGIINAEEAMFHSQRHLISNAIGFSDMRIEIGPSLMMAPKDTLLLATDGLLDNVTLEEICVAIRTGPLMQVANYLADLCHQRMGGGEAGSPTKPDDLTFILYRQRY